MSRGQECTYAQEGSPIALSCTDAVSALRKEVRATVLAPLLRACQQFRENLPIYKFKWDLLDALGTHQVRRTRAFRATYNTKLIKYQGD